MGRLNAVAEALNDALKQRAGDVSSSMDAASQPAIDILFPFGDAAMQDERSRNNSLHDPFTHRMGPAYTCGPGAGRPRHYRS